MSVYMDAPRTSEGKSLPPVIKLRMEALRLRPSWSELAKVSQLPITTLQNTLKVGNKPVVTTFRKLAGGLKMSMDELYELLGW